MLRTSILRQKVARRLTGLDELLRIKPRLLALPVRVSRTNVIAVLFGRVRLFFERDVVAVVSPRVNHALFTWKANAI
jgi:hypothetical protein